MRIKGSGLVDYIVPTATIGLVLGIALYTFLGSGSLEKFIGASGNMAMDHDKHEAVIGGDLTNEIPVPKGSPDAPIKTCSSGTCNIDNGKWILTGIPDDFTSFVQTAGTSGATDSLLSLVDQMAKQMDNPETPEDEGGELKDLANLGHFIGEFESKIENVTDYCKGQADQFKCMQENFWIGKTPISVSVPADLNHILTGFPTGSTSFGTQSNQFLDFGRATKYCSPPTSCSSSSSPVHAFNEIYYNVMNDVNQTYTPETKAIIKELYEDVALLGNDLSLMVDNAAGGSASGGGYDPLTGASIVVTYPKVSDLSQITNPATSVGSHLDSAIICATGGTPDTGYSCK